MRAKLIALVCCFVALFAGCGGGFKAGETKVVEVPPPVFKEGDTIEFGMYPAAYTIGNELFPFINEATVDLKYVLYNNLDFSSPCKITIVQPSTNALKRNKGYVAWQDAVVYCQTVGEIIVPPHGSTDATLRIMLPAGVSAPKKWMFYVSYKSEGHTWGDYVETASKNFVFTPPNFSCDITDVNQKFSYLTNGNSPKIHVVQKYDTPPANFNDGKVVFEGNGTQVRYPWVDPNSGKTLERQYTNYEFSTAEVLPSFGGEKLFYRAWIQHIVNGIWDGTWDAIGQSMMIPEVQAKVLVNM